ncbi:MAG TPA: transposase [Gemmatimonadaceae bacterium]
MGPDLDTRRRRQLLRGRAFLVRERTRIKNRIHGHLTAENHCFPHSDLYGKAGRACLESVALSPVLAAETQRLLHLHDVLTKEIGRLDYQVKRAARQDPIARRLAAIPGVGVFGAVFLHAEIGPIDRFPSSHQLAAYAGLVPTTRSSGGKTTHGPLAQMSNHWRKWFLVEIVQSSSWRRVRSGRTIAICCGRRANRKRPAPPRGNCVSISIGC